VASYNNFRGKCRKDQSPEPAMVCSDFLLSAFKRVNGSTKLVLMVFWAS